MVGEVIGATFLFGVEAKKKPLMATVTKSTSGF
jgi:hypothetical protein